MGAAMSTTEQHVRDLDKFVGLAGELGRRFEPYVAEHDRNGSFAHEAFDILRESGYLALAVPTELGGMGASIAEVAMAQAEMARYDASTSARGFDASHITLFAAWPLSPSDARRGRHAATRLRRAHRLGVDGRLRLHPSERHG
jgi:alkylation response protein AidB-like acyl-CoA dehydrogenase